MERLLDINETAEWARSTPSALYTQRHRGIEPGALAVRVGKKLLWREADLTAWFESQREAQAVGA